MDGANKQDEDGDTRMDDDDDDDEASPEKKGPNGIKTAKKSAGKKVDIDDSKKGKKRKADGDAEKGPKQKKRKEEPKPKAAKPKGISFISYLSLDHLFQSPPVSALRRAAKPFGIIGRPQPIAALPLNDNPAHIVSSRIDGELHYEGFSHLMYTGLQENLAVCLDPSFVASLSDFSLRNLEKLSNLNY